MTTGAMTGEVIGIEEVSLVYRAKTPRSLRSTAY